MQNDFLLTARVVISGGEDIHEQLHSLSPVQAMILEYYSRCRADNIACEWEDNSIILYEVHSDSFDFG